MQAENCIIFSADSGSYTNRSGDEVIYTNINYFDVSDKFDNKSWRGYVPLKMNVYPDFNLSDFSSVPGCYSLAFRAAPSRIKGNLTQFPTVPGYYHIEFEQIRGRDGKALFIPVMVKFEAPFVPNQSQSQSE